MPIWTRSVGASACTYIHQRRSKSEQRMRWLSAGDTGDAAIKASATQETPLEHLLKQRAVVSQQVERHAFETTGKIHCPHPLAHDPTLTLTCIFAPVPTTEITWSMPLPAVEMHPDSQFNTGIASMPEAIGPR